MRDCNRPRAEIRTIPMPPFRECAAGAIAQRLASLTTNNRKTAAALERNILQPLLVYTAQTI